APPALSPLSLHDALPICALALNATLYDRRTSRIVSAIGLPPSVGYGLLTNDAGVVSNKGFELTLAGGVLRGAGVTWDVSLAAWRSEEHTSELQSRENLVC